MSRITVTAMFVICALCMGTGVVSPPDVKADEYSGAGVAAAMDAAQTNTGSRNFVDVTGKFGKNFHNKGWGTSMGMAFNFDTLSVGVGYGMVDPRQKFDLSGLPGLNGNHQHDHGLNAEHAVGVAVSFGF